MKLIRTIKAYHNPFYSDKNFWLNVARELNGELTSFDSNKYNNKFYIHLCNLQINNYKDVGIDINIDAGDSGTIYKPEFTYFIGFDNKEKSQEFEVSYRDAFPENAQALKDSIAWSIDNFVKENEEFDNIEEIGD